VTKQVGVTQHVTPVVGATGYVRVTVEVCGYKICIESGTLRLGMTKYMTDIFQCRSDQIGKTDIYDMPATCISVQPQIWER
jgi:hypothetical protein